MNFNFGFNIGDTLYVAYPEYCKVCRFETDCIKVFRNNMTVHGKVFGLHGNYGLPAEISIKYLNKRVVFTKKKDAENWLKSKMK